MDALVMCGGQGSRLEAPTEKPLFEVGGEPMLERVLAALAESEVETVHAAVTAAVPETRRLLERRPVSRIETPGEGYVADLDHALDRLAEPILTVASDLPLLAADAIDRVLAVHDAGSLTVAVPAALKRVLGLSVDATLEADGSRLAPTGVNVVGTGGDTTHVTHDVRFAVNVNRRSDAAVAEALV